MSEELQYIESSVNAEKIVEPVDDVRV